MRLSNTIVILSLMCTTLILCSCSKKLERFYDNEKKHIEFRFKGRYKNGAFYRNGKAENFYDNGQLRGIEYYKNDAQTGIERQYHLNGQCALQAHWENGKRIDTTITFFESGNKESIEIYDHDGNSIERISFYDNGQLHSHWRIEDDKNRKGFFTYLENGKVESHLVYDTAGFDRIFTQYYSETQKRYSSWDKITDNSDTLGFDTSWSRAGNCESVVHTVGNIVLLSLEYDNFFENNPYLKKEIRFNPSDSSYSHVEYHANKKIALTYKTIASRNTETNRDTLPGTAFIYYFENGKKESEYILRVDTSSVEEDDKPKRILEKVNQWDESGKQIIKNGINLEDLRKRIAFENKYKMYLGAWILISENRIGNKNGKACNETKRYTVKKSKKLMHFFISDLFENLQVNYCYNDYEYRCNEFKASIIGNKFIYSEDQDNESHISVSGKTLTIIDTYDSFKEYGSDENYSNVRITEMYQYVGKEIPEYFSSSKAEFPNGDL